MACDPPVGGPDHPTIIVTCNPEGCPVNGDAPTAASAQVVSQWHRRSRPRTLPPREPLVLPPRRQRWCADVLAARASKDPFCSVNNSDGCPGEEAKGLRGWGGHATLPAPLPFPSPLLQWQAAVHQAWESMAKQSSLGCGHGRRSFPSRPSAERQTAGHRPKPRGSPQNT